ncbi:MAG: methionine adenosyltransferase [Saprospiraceae bacterium]|nr:methionine adenosyltransferase [Candidatus Defluviibacterium haderslevense]
MNSLNHFYFTSESVSEGHPDKVADQISDAILDAYLELDPNAKVACESLITTGQLVIAGEIYSTAHVDVVAVARDVIRQIGYDDPAVGFDYATAAYINLLHNQSPEINQSVSDGGAGDQGLMFGYACKETVWRMPLPITMSHELMIRLATMRRSGKHNWLRPDAKCQVTVEYKRDVPVGIETMVLSTQHSEDISQAEIKSVMQTELILPLAQEYFYNSQPKILVNPSGSFTIGGPHGDTGLTGRKIIVDSYGGSCPHGGGAFSGKDPSKVDRSAAYAARYVANHIVSAGLAERCTVQISYAIGLAEPTSIYVNTHGTGSKADEFIAQHISKVFDLRPEGIISALDLKRPIYKETAAYGHFGRNQFPWEKLDKTIIKILENI